jgi:3-deoxy-D-manno-octulosonic-acid transferase
MPYLIVKIILDPRYRMGIKERLGFVSITEKTHRRFLVHASSVGEVNVAVPFIKELLNHYKDYEVILTVVTPEGYSSAREKLEATAKVFYFCLDCKYCVERFLNKINPDAAFIIETEIWPNFLRALRARGIKTGIINGRISEKSFKRYKRIKGFIRAVLKNADFFLMQDETYRMRLKALAEKDDNIKVAGNIKFDIDDSFFKIDDELLQIVSRLNYIAAGSTHDGEEAKLISIFPDIKKGYPDIKLVIAPRHIKRCPAIESLLSEKGVSYIKRTRLKSDTDLSGYDVILVDTIGDLVTFFKSAKIVFIGGSLVNVGGHNIIEPAYFRKPIIFGRFMQNFTDAKDIILNAGGAVLVKNEFELKKKILYLLQNEEELNRMGSNAKLAFNNNKGALETTIAEIKRHVD